MQMIILSIHLLVSVCLIGLVLLQRSEGGALGIGGGGGGALMSGRGASDALARLTSIAGALFLAVSLLLTWLSGAGDGPGRSVFDSLPAITTPAAPAETAPAPAETPAPTTPDPTQSSVATSNELAAAILPGPAPAAAETSAPSSARAAPIEARPAPAQPAAQRTPAATTQRPSNQSASTTSPARTPPAQQGAVSGVTLAEPTTPESVDLGNGVEAVRRERAGPDQ